MSIIWTTRDGEAGTLTMALKGEPNMRTETNEPMKPTTRVVFSLLSKWNAYV